jgi:multicomponent Na+:H+ antiporter subunit G
MTIVLSWILLIIGAIILLMAAVGLLVFPDVYTRLAATGKATTLGQTALLLGVALQLPLGLDTFKVIFIIVFILLSTPVASHLVARAAYRSGVPLTLQTQCDQWDEKNNLTSRQPRV